MKKTGVDLVVQDRPAPALLDGRPGVPLPLGLVLHAVEQHAVVAPGDLSHKLWDNCLVHPDLR